MSSRDSKFGKRFFDLFLAFLILIIFLPVFSVLSILVYFAFGRPIFFRQVRPGLNGKPFTTDKFRTMTNERDGNGNLLPDDKRLTSFGRFLRSMSLDELPELLNVLKGEMSLAGQRVFLNSIFFN